MLIKKILYLFICLQTNQLLSMDDGYDYIIEGSSSKNDTENHKNIKDETKNPSDQINSLFNRLRDEINIICSYRHKDPLKFITLADEKNSIPKLEIIVKELMILDSNNKLNKSHYESIKSQADLFYYQIIQCNCFEKDPIKFKEILSKCRDSFEQLIKINENITPKIETAQNILIPYYIEINTKDPEVYKNYLLDKNKNILAKYTQAKELIEKILSDKEKPTKLFNYIHSIKKQLVEIHTTITSLHKPANPKHIL